ncbi:MAG: Cof-type HAD-IIB family hydrolase [Mycoplasmatales bacterium]
MVFDFDGTILNANGEITEKLVNKLIDLQQQGYKVVLCSGRSLPGIMWVADKINLAQYHGYIVAYNGSQVYRYQNQVLEQLYQGFFTKEQVTNIAKLVVDEVQSLATYDENYMGVSKKIPILERSSKTRKVELNYNYIKETPNIVLFDTAEVVAQKYEILKEKVLNYDKTLNFFSSIPHLIEITPQNSSKGHGLKIIAQKENSDYNEFICFGDAENDLSMFEFCKYAVAMENAMEQVKVLATHHTKTNNEDVVLYFLETKFKNI